MDKIIEVKNLKKSYGDIQAVRGIDFYVEQGKQFAFLGPNGAGKSTTIDIICTLLKSDQGHVVIDGYELGKDDRRIRERIGVVFQDGVLDPLLTVRENLSTRARFYTKDRAAIASAVGRAIELADVSEFADRRYGKLSGGQQRRADIARALVNTPKILFLDEPTTGLDPQTRKSVWNTIRRLQQEEGVTIFLTTHYMEEAATADYIIIIDHGMIAAKGTPYELRAKYSADTLRMQPQGDGAALAALLEGLGVAYTRKGELFIVELSDTWDALPILERARLEIQAFEIALATMDDVFINITGKEVREDA